MDKDLSIYSLDSDLQEFLNFWEFNDLCAISSWCHDRDGTIRDNIDDFIEICNRDPNIARVSFYHISAILNEDLREIFINSVLNNPVQAGLMWKSDETLTEEEAQILFDCFMEGAPSYREAYLNGDIVAPERNKQFNKNSGLLEKLNG